MTIIMKTVTDKKPDKSVLPLVTGDGVDSVTVEVPGSLSDREVVDRDLGVCGLSYGTTMYLFFIAMMVMTCGIIGGLYLYDEYGREETRSFQGWCEVKYDDNNLFKQPLRSEGIYFDNEDFLPNVLMNDEVKSLLANSLREHIEIGLEGETYEKIDVPEFRNGRRGRFIHDFVNNQTGILDPEGKRCFIMPLDRDAVLPPNSLLDLVNKMWKGYYDVNMTIVKQNLQVVLPPLTDVSSLGVYIAKECEKYPIYRLEKFVHGVFKRSLGEVSKAKFTQFAGKALQELDILNIDDLLQYEEELNKNN